MTPSVLDTALHYAQALGWPVFPVNRRKQPLTKTGFKEATTDAATIRRLFARPDVQVAVPTGAASGLFVLDLDHDPAKGYDLAATRERLTAQYGPLPPTPHQQTGRGGLQYFFAYHEGLRNTAGALGAGIDTRGEGGYVVVPPSHNTVGPYTWLADPENTPLAPVPAWLLEALQPAPAAPVPPKIDRTESSGTAYAQAALKEELDALTRATNGMRNDQLNRSAFNLGQLVGAGVLDRSEVEQQLAATASAIGLTGREITKTIASGLQAGEAQPRTLPEPKHPNGHAAPARAPMPLDKLTRLLGQLAPEHWSNYDDWYRIGAALHEWAGADAARQATAYAVWDQFSQERASDYCEGMPAAWDSFSEGHGPHVTLGTLIHWRREAQQAARAAGQEEQEAEERPMSERMRDALARLGYTFRLNLTDDTIEVNGKRLDEVTRHALRTLARDHHIEPLAALEDVYITTAARDAYHPVHDYLNGLTWDGRDHIGALAAYLTSSDPPVSYPDGSTQPLHAVYLRRWLIGAVAKAFDRHQNLVLVLAGPQGIGKSALVRWLASGLADLFVEAPINVNEKDSEVRLMSRFIWEVSELDATTRRADVAALKAFVTKDQVVVRKAYGHHDTVKPALASFVGTVNEGSGFLSDETGNRRFAVTSLTAIDWQYTALDVQQLWAQAVALYRAGEPWRLQPCEIVQQQQANKRHEVETVLEGWISKHFFLNTDANSLMSAADILDHLRNYDIHLGGSSRAQAMELSSVLTRLGVQKFRTTGWRGYRGISPRHAPAPPPPAPPPDDDNLNDNLDDNLAKTGMASGRPNDNLTTCDDHFPYEERESSRHAPDGPVHDAPLLVSLNSKKVVIGCHSTDGAQQDATNSDDNLSGAGCHEVVISGEVVIDRFARVSWEDVRRWLVAGQTPAIHTHCVMRGLDMHDVITEAYLRWPELEHLVPETERSAV